MVKIIFGRGLVGIEARATTHSHTGILNLSGLKEKCLVGKPYAKEQSDPVQVSMRFENTQSLDVLILQLNKIRSDMLNELSPELRMGA